jgi:rare lipoprotein A
MEAMELIKLPFSLKRAICFIKQSFFFISIIFPSICFSFELKDTVDNIKNKELTGIASFYSNKFNGRKTASGELFSQKKMTAACNKLPLGTRVKVVNLQNNKSVELIINDRLHHKNRRLVDLSLAAAKELEFHQKGITKVKVIVLQTAHK